MNVHHETAYGVFEWDHNKDAANLRKHGLDFLAAAEIFCDERALIRHDASHSGQEERFKIVGRVQAFRVITVIFTDRHNVTRLISARKATSEEVRDYERHFQNGLGRH